MAVETGYVTPYGLRWGTMGRGYFTGDFGRKVRFCFIRRPYLLGVPADV